MKLRRLAAMAAAICFVLMLNACESPKAPPAPTTAPAAEALAPTNPGAMKDLSTPVGNAAPDMKLETGDTLVGRLPVEMKHLNPLTGSDAYASRIGAYLFDSLLDRDPVTLESMPLVAESWEVSPDHLVYTFKIREGIKFHDGVPLTVEDVKFTFDKLMDPLVDAPELRNYYADVISCEIVDANTIRYTCSKAFWLHLVMLGDLPVIPKHIYGVGDFNEHPNNRNPIGSGPYKFQEWKTNQQVIITRNAEYWGAAIGRQGHVDRWIWEIVTDDNAALLKLKRGDFDLLALLPKEWVNEASKPDFVARFNKKEWSTPAFQYIGWNSRRSFFSDANIRRAMTMFLDRESIRQKVYYGLAEHLTGQFLPGTPEYDESLTVIPFDPAGASALLDEAGWVDSNGDGVRDKDGVKFSFSITLPTNAEQWESIATILQEELKRAGVEMNIRKLEWATMLEHIDKRDFDAVILAWSMTPDPDMYQIWHSTQADKGSNYVGFNNPEADAIIEQMRASFDREERIQLCRRFHGILYEQQPYTFLFTPKALLATDKRIHNTVIYPLFRTRPYLEWFVPAELQKRR